MEEYYTVDDNEDLITKFEFLKDMPGYNIVHAVNSACNGISPAAAALLGWKKLMMV